MPQPQPYIVQPYHDGNRTDGPHRNYALSKPECEKHEDKREGGRPDGRPLANKACCSAPLNGDHAARDTMLCGMPCPSFVPTSLCRMALSEISLHGLAHSRTRARALVQRARAHARTHACMGQSGCKSSRR